MNRKCRCSKHAYSSVMTARLNAISSSILKDQMPSSTNRHTMRIDASSSKSTLLKSSFVLLLCMEWLQVMYRCRSRCAFGFFDAITAALTSVPHFNRLDWFVWWFARQHGSMMWWNSSMRKKLSISVCPYGMSYCQFSRFIRCHYHHFHSFFSSLIVVTIYRVSSSSHQSWYQAWPNCWIM